MVEKTSFENLVALAKEKYGHYTQTEEEKAYWASKAKGGNSSLNAVQSSTKNNKTKALKTYKKKLVLDSKRFPKFLKENATENMPMDDYLNIDAISSSTIAERAKGTEIEFQHYLVKKAAESKDRQKKHFIKGTHIHDFVEYIVRKGAAIKNELKEQAELFLHNYISAEVKYSTRSGDDCKTYIKHLAAHTDDKDLAQEAYDLIAEGGKPKIADLREMVSDLKDSITKLYINLEDANAIRSIAKELQRLENRNRIFSTFLAHLVPEVVFQFVKDGVKIRPDLLAADCYVSVKTAGRGLDWFYKNGSLYDDVHKLNYHIKEGLYAKYLKRSLVFMVICTKTFQIRFIKINQEVLDDWIAKAEKALTDTKATLAKIDEGETLTGYEVYATENRLGIEVH